MIYIVSGLPRSGTSLLMQMLREGGMSIASDGKRVADEDNPRGYLEVEGIIDRIKGDPECVSEYDGKAVKIVSHGLRFLPIGEYKVLYSERSIEEVLDSMETMQGKPHEDRSELKNVLERENENVKRMIEKREDVRLLVVNYNHVLDDPMTVVMRVKEFLKESRLDAGKMESVVDDALYRNRENDKEMIIKRLKKLGYIDG